MTSSVTLAQTLHTLGSYHKPERPGLVNATAHRSTHSKHSVPYWAGTRAFRSPDHGVQSAVLTGNVVCRDDEPAGDSAQPDQVPGPGRGGPDAGHGLRAPDQAHLRRGARPEQGPPPEHHVHRNLA
eukprot:3836073-Rhodomonas_salina.1